MFNKNYQKILLGLQRLVGSLRLGSNIPDCSKDSQGIGKDLVFSLDLQTIAAERPPIIDAMSEFNSNTLRVPREYPPNQRISDIPRSVLEPAESSSKNLIL